MNRREFSDLVAYIKNRPDEAKRLREALGEAVSNADHNVWLSAQRAGELIGKSGKWVREHLDLFPSATQMGGRNAWLVRKSEVVTNYNIYLTNQSK